MRNLNHFYLKLLKRIISVTVITCLFFSYLYSQPCSNPPIAQFTASPDSNCSSQIVSFTNMSVGIGLTYQWYFRDGANYNDISDISANPSHNFYAAIGTTYQTFDVMLKVTDQDGCFDTISHPIVIKQSPFVDFMEVGNFRRCENVVATISDTAKIYNYSDIPNILSYQIDWGDGGGFVPITAPFTNTAYISHVYNAVNNYPITIIALGNNGCYTTFRDTFKIITIPLPEFSSLPFSSGCAPFSVFTVNNSSGITSNTITYVDWGDNIIDTLPIGTLPGGTLWHTYVNTTCLNGLQLPYTIMLTTQNECGAPFKSYGPVSVFAPPQAQVDIVDDSVCVGNPAIFLNQTIPNFCAANPRTLYTWDFGDSTSATVWATMLNPAPGITHIYNYPGVFTVILKAENNSLPSTGHPGCGSTLDSILVYVFEVYAEFTFDTVCLNSPTQFTDLSTVSGGTITSWFWDFGDGGTSSLQNPQHTYTTQGQYTVTLFVTDSLGCTDVITHNILVDSLPKANFLYSNTCFGDTTFFSNLSIPNSDSITAFYWNFGDGTIDSIHNNPFHIFQTSGNHNVTLTIYNSKGCQNDTIINVIVHPNPIASFITDTVCSGYQKNFINNSTTTGVPIASFSWSFGDGANSTFQHPAHIFNSFLPFNVLLIATNINGCIDSVIHRIAFDTLPNPFFAATNTCIGDTTFFTDLSTYTTNPIISRIWNFGDGNTDTVQNPYHIYQNSGTYNVTLTVTNSIGCVNDTTITVNVWALPTPSFIVTTPCKGQTANFSPITATPLYTSWNWTFGDGSIDSIQYPAHVYATSGNYNVQLLVSDIHGCRGDSTMAVFVSPLPIANFIFDTACSGSAIHFTDVSVDSGYAITTWNWNFGDLSLSNIANPSHIYINPNLYSVNLHVTNIYGCVDSVNHTIKVDTNSVAAFTSNIVTIGSPTVFNTIPNPSLPPITAWSWNFDDGNTSNINNPTHVYATTDTFHVILSVTNIHGCIDTVVQNVIVYSLLNLSFSVNQVCLGDSSHFFDNSSSPGGAITNWYWNFGDGDTINAHNPVHKYAAAGNYTVWITVTDINGNRDSLSHIAVVKPNPIAVFYSDTVCADDTTHFSNISTTLGATINSWNWNFGDGSLASTLQNSKHKYPTVATITNYNVRLIITDSVGCKDTAINQQIIYPPVLAEFITDTVCSNFPVQVTDISQSAYGNITAWNWNFGNGSGTSNVQNPNYTYPSSLNDTSYNVRLIATDILGCKDTIFHPLLVHPLPIANFKSDTSCLNFPTHFTDSSFSLGGALSLWNWNFGGTGVSTLQNPSFTFLSPGSFNTTLSVTDVNGCINSTTIPIVVDSIPEVNFTFHGNCAIGLMNFTDISLSHGSINNSWEWDFGDSYFAFAQNPIHYYTSMDTFNVILTVGNANGCHGILNKQVYVTPPMTYDFVADTVCYGYTTHFTDSFLVQTSQIATWSWDFGDGFSSTLHNPSHLYAFAGTYNVSLTVLDTNACSETIHHYVLVNVKPIVNFTNTSVCAGDSTIFTDNTVSAAPIISYLWNFGDGYTSTLPNPSHLYNASGNYNVKLMVVNANGCSDSITKNILVNVKQVANFSVENVCFGFPVVITDSSFNALSSISSWLWKFGDGDSLFIPNPTFYLPTISHIYSTAGNYTVSLKISYNTCSDTLSKNVLIYNAPLAGFISPNKCVGDTTFFTDTTLTFGYPIVNWTWNFGDGGSSNLQNPNHVYAQAGTYAVILTVVDSRGCSNTINKNIVVYGQPIANFTYSQTCFHDSTHFSDLSLGNGALINNWNWKYGDVSMNGTSQTPTHYYNNQGSFNVQLIVRNTRGCIDTLVQAISIDSLPKANFTSNIVCKGMQTFFTNTSIDQGSFNNSWKWNFGDGIGTSTLQNPFYTYQNHGVFIAKLLVSNQKGCKDSITHAVQVDTIPFVGFTVDSACLGLPTHFTNTSHSFGNLALSYSWDFGDNTTLSSLQNPIHTYAIPNNYVVSLTATDAHSCSNSILKTVVVHNLPIAGFTANVVQFPFITNFTNTSVGNPATVSNWNWNFGDGVGSSILQNPSYNFTAADTFNTRLIVTDTNGCKDTVIHPVIVYSPFIHADFGYSATCEKTFTFFTDSSAIGAGNVILSWHWNFGDASTSILQNPQHQYLNAGTYNVKLIVVGTNVTDSIVKTVVIYPRPHADFDNTAVCFGVSKTFTNLSTVQNGNIIIWNWDFGNGNTANTMNPSTIYNAFGNYNVLLSVATDMGCSDTITKIVKINPLPVISFTPDITEGCVPVFVNFTSTATVDSGIISSWSWDFGDGNIVIGNTNLIGHNFNNSGSYNISLKATSNAGCDNTLMVPNMVVAHPNPEAIFTVTPPITTILYPSILFTDNSIEATKWNWYFGDGDSSLAQSPTHIYNQSGIYFPLLRVTTDFGCTDESTMKVEIMKVATFFIPNAFTPNNDGYNDVFMPKSVDFSQGKYEFMIFNRWGEMVFYTNDYNTGWNGSYNGNANICYDGVYVWKINYTDALGRSQMEIGRVTLIK